jgi:hypothetical protein
LVVTNVRAYPAGVALTVRLGLRTPVAGRRHDWMDRPDDLLFSFDSGEPGQPLLQHRGGGGSETDWDAECWLWPLPPPGPLTFACVWPAGGVPESRVTLDAGLVHRAAADALPRFAEPG